MNRITLRWKRTTYTELLTHNDYFFYAISRGKNLLYIGNTQDQHVKDRLKQHVVQKFDRETRGLTFWLADIDSQTFVIDRKNQAQVIHDTESLLIFRNQPSLNHQCKVNYTGAMDLRIISHNCPRLKAKIESPK